jgi:hypothetical protein
MNSKYAPITALTVLLVLVIAALGWFVLIKPRFSDAADTSNQAAEVDTNTSQIQQATAKLGQYEEQLAALPPLDDSIALNLPALTDIQAYRARINEAAQASKVSIVSLAMDSSYVVDGWQMPPQSRVSYSIAQLFAKGPLEVDSSSSSSDEASPEPSAEPGEGGSSDGYTPVVTPSTETGPVVSDLNGLPVTITIAGGYSATANFLASLTNSEDQIFLIYETSQTARNADASSIAGVPDAKDGDIITEIVGAFYLLDPDTTAIDEDELTTVRPGGRSPFAPSAGQP